MITSELIFITITLGLLLFTVYSMNIPKASAPLVLIYILFIIFKVGSSDDSKIVSEIIPKIEEDPIELHNETKYVEADPITRTKPIKSIVEPKPLTFDSGRTDKNLPKKKKAKKEIESPKMVEKKIKRIIGDQISVKDIKICKNIYKRTPVGADNIFSNTVDSLYCYTRIQNKGSKKEIKHVWYYRDQVMTQVIYNVKKSNIYRSWTKKTILPNQIGKWRVDVINSEGTIIGSKKFEITSVSEVN